MQNTERITLQSAAVATGNGTAANVAGRSRIGVQVTGITTATITFEATIDGSNWVALAMSPAGGGAAATTVTADGLVSGTVAGFAQFRARISAYTSGTITATGLVTDAPA